jgi:hypothetical protein
MCRPEGRRYVEHTVQLFLGHYTRNPWGVLFRGCLEFGGYPVNGPLAVFVFPSSHGYKGKVRTIDTPSTP